MSNLQEIQNLVFKGIIAIIIWIFNLIPKRYHLKQISSQTCDMSVGYENMSSLLYYDFNDSKKNKQDHTRKNLNIGDEVISEEDATTPLML